MCAWHLCLMLFVLYTHYDLLIQNITYTTSPTQIKNHPYFSQHTCCVLLLIVLSTTGNMFYCYMCSMLFCYKGKQKGRLSLFLACFCTYSFIKWFVVYRGVDCGEWWILLVFKINSILYWDFHKNLFFIIFLISGLQCFKQSDEMHFFQFSLKKFLLRG